MSYTRVKLTQFGDPTSVLSFDTVTTGIPTPCDDEVVIQVTASPIQPFDFVCIQGARHDTSTKFQPISPGCEGVGYLHAVGKNITEFSVGQRVAFLSYTGAWSEYLVMKAPFEFLVTVPDNLPDTSAGQLTAPLTMYGLFEIANASQNDWVLQTAAGSVLGQMAIQYARVKNLKMINIVRRKAQVDELKARYGAETHVVVFDGQNEAEAIEQVNAITQNKGVNIVFEAVGGTTFDFALKVLAQNGHLLSYGVMSGNIIMQVPFGILITKAPKIEGFPVNTWFASKSAAEKKRVVDDLIDLMVTKKVVPVTEAIHSFQEWKEAIVKSTTPGKSGRIFLAAHPEKFFVYHGKYAAVAGKQIQKDRSLEINIQE